MSYSKLIATLAVILVLFLVAFGGFLFWENSKLNKELAVQALDNNAINSPATSNLLVDTLDKNTTKPAEVESKTIVAQNAPPIIQKSEPQPQPPQQKPKVKPKLESQAKSTSQTQAQTQPKTEPQPEVQNKPTPEINTQDQYNTPDGNSVRIITPNGGENYKTLENIKIKWDSNISGFDTSNAYIEFQKLKGDAWDSSNPTLYRENVNSLDVTTGVGVNNVKELNWTIPKFTTPGKYVAYIMISYWSNIYKPSYVFGGTHNDWSDTPFTISTDENTAAAIPTITNLNPSIAKRGSEVTATGTGFIPNSVVNLIDTNKGVSLAETTVLSSTTLKFTIPTFVAEGQQSVIVINTNGESQGKDMIISK